MPAINARELARQFEADPRKSAQNLTEALGSKQLRPDDFSIRDLFEEFVDDGPELLRLMAPRKSGGLSLLEAGGNLVSTARFSNITGQLIYSAILDGAMSEQFVFTQAVRTISTQLNGEKIPGVTHLGDEAEIVNEGDIYPTSGVNEDWIETPATVKRGFIVPVTKEAIFFDRTGLVMDRARNVGESLGLNKEKRIIDAVIDENTTRHRFKWRGTVYGTYQTSTPWINSATSNALVDWTDINAVEQLFNNMVDLNTGEPITAQANTLIVTPQNRATAFHILNATTVALSAGGFAQSGNLYRSDAPTPLGNHEFTGTYRVLSSRLLAARLATDTDWFMADLNKAVAYMENWPITVTQAAANSEAEFTQDIVARFKASERGAAVVLNPQAICKSAQ